MKAREIQDWLISHVSALLQIAPGAIDIHEPFSEYGLSSRDAVALSGELEEWLDCTLSPTLAFDHPSISELALHLSTEQEGLPSAPTDAAPPTSSSEPIAIIGLGCRFPKAESPRAFWQLLRDGADAIREIPDDRWPMDAYYHPDRSAPGKTVSRWGGFLNRIDQFDPFFFGISPREAKYMDPQQRLLLELSWEALDDAGYAPEEQEDSATGVFIGISINEYSQAQFGDPSRISSLSGTGNALSIAANRISYFFNFHGPSMAIDTACSSSLAAIHLACQSLRNGECQMALAGGVNLILSPAHAIAFSKAGVLAPDGRCKTFDAAADGYVRGEGGGMIVLKPLSAALAAGDPIQGLILGSAMVQDGRTNGLMAPSHEAQAGLLQKACQAANIPPGSLQYVEAHGTGTLLGDSMEAQALGEVIGKKRKRTPLAIGSVKTNIGHLEAAAGIAGLIKTVMSIQHRQLPPSLHYQTPNPHIPFPDLNLRVNGKLTPWPEEKGPARAGVSSFGFGGTNVHLIVQEAPPSRQEAENPSAISKDTFHLLPLSANSYGALQSLAGEVRAMLPDGPELADLCRAAGKRRGQFAYRLSVTGGSADEMAEALDAFRREELHPRLFPAVLAPQQAPRLVFVFPGQGGQWYGMGRDLLEQEPVFRQAILRIDELIGPAFGWSLLDLLQSGEARGQLEQIDRAQPAIFAIQVALAELWKSWGITPDTVTGHSMGEVAACQVAGALSLEDAVKIICGRSRLMKDLRGQGSMLATELTPAQAEEWSRSYEGVSLAVVNGPASTVLSGDTESLEDIRQELEQQELFCRPVRVDVASHSAQMDVLRLPLQESLADLRPKAATIPIYSTVTGQPILEAAFDAAYWMDNLRKPVLFAPVVERLLNDDHTIFIEIGPHPILLGAIQQISESRQADVRMLPSLRREEPAREVMLHTLATLYTEGLSIDWDGLYPGPGKQIKLPAPPWQRQRYWLETAPGGGGLYRQPNQQAAHPLLGQRLDLAHTPSTFVWQSWLDPENIPFLKDHRIQEEIVLPAAAYLEMALQAMEEAGLPNNPLPSNFVFQEKMVMQEGRPRNVQTHLSPREKEGFDLEIYSRAEPEENWTLHATASLLPRTEQRTTPPPSPLPEDQRILHADFYQNLRTRGLQYGPAFQGVQEVQSGEKEALGRIRLPDSLQFDAANFHFHPALLDACLQVLAGIGSHQKGQDLFLPLGCRSFLLHKRPTEGFLWSRAMLKSGDSNNTGSITADIHLLDEDHQLIAQIEGLQLQRRRPSLRGLLSHKDTWLYQLGWKALEAEENAGPVPPGKHWLILSDNSGMGEEIGRLLEARGDSVYLWPCPQGMGHAEADNTFREELEGKLRELPASLHGILHLWSLSAPPAGSAQAEEEANTAFLVCNSVLLLVQALARQLSVPPRLWLLTRGAQPVNSDTPVAVEQSALWGLGKVISFELPELKCVRIDLDPQQEVKEAAPALLRQLSAEDGEDQTAFRGGMRYVSRLLPFQPPPACQTDDVFLRPEATYLITGGMGGLGISTARWMAGRGARYLVLLGRSAPDDAAGQAIEEMRRQGVEVLIARADVSDADQMEKIFSRIAIELPPLRGVIHAAGLLDDGALVNLDSERMKRVMAPKVAGSWNLHRLTSDLSLDFFVLFSSAVSVLGSPGQGNYAAASTYLDALAHYRRHLGLPALSINWGPWAEVGLAAEAAGRLEEQNASTQHLVKVIQIDRGLAILEQLLALPSPQVAVLPFDLKNLLELYPTAASMPFFAEVGGSDTHVARLYARPNLRQAYVAPRNELERKLAELWRQTLHIDRIGIHDSFFELGGDSVLATQLLGLAQKTFGIRISPQEAFQAFTIEKLAGMLEAAILKQIEQMSEEEARQLLSKMK